MILGTSFVASASVAGQATNNGAELKSIPKFTEPKK